VTDLTGVPSASQKRRAESLQERQLEKFFPAGHLVFNEQLEGSGSVTVC
jgi:hypothetical protein